MERRARGLEESEVDIVGAVRELLNVTTRRHRLLPRTVGPGGSSQSHYHNQVVESTGPVLDRRRIQNLFMTVD